MLNKIYMQHCFDDSKRVYTGYCVRTTCTWKLLCQQFLCYYYFFTDFLNFTNFDKIFEKILYFSSFLLHISSSESISCINTKGQLKTLLSDKRRPNLTVSWYYIDILICLICNFFSGSKDFLCVLLSINILKKENFTEQTFKYNKIH